MERRTSDYKSSQEGMIQYFIYGKNHRQPSLWKGFFILKSDQVPVVQDPTSAKKGAAASFEKRLGNGFS